MNSLKYLLLCVFAFPVVAIGEEEAASRFGPGKAIEAFSEEDGFKMSAKAISTLGVRFDSIRGSGPWRVSKSSLIHIKQSTGVYRRYEGWISMVLVKVVSQTGDTALITSQDLEPEDEIAAQGVQFLRMTDADLNAGTVDNCAH